jgi:hypothetical protein
MIFFIACASITGDKEYKSGVVDYRMIKENSSGINTIVLKAFDSNESKSYFTNGDIIDIRLSNIMYNSYFDPKLLRKNHNKLLNNIGVFVTVKEIFIDDNLSDKIYTYPENALIYTGNVYVKANANQFFTPIYLSEYHGGDLQIELNVVEFDQQGKGSKRYMPLLSHIVELSQNVIRNNLIGKVIAEAGKNYFGMSDLNTLGSSLLNAFSKGHDDLITTYKLNLISPKTIKNKNLHKLPYLKEGDIVFVRREAGDRNNKISHWKDFKYNPKEKTIEDIYEYKDNNKKYTKLFKNYYSYIVLTIIKREKHMPTAKLN